MKRCPKCDFLYLDSDQVCDLDGSVLVKADASVETLIKEQESRPARQSWKAVVIVALAVLAFGMFFFFIYQRLSQHTQNPNLDDSANIPVIQQPPVVLSSPAETGPTPTPEPSISPATKPSPSARAPDRGGLSS